MIEKIKSEESVYNGKIIHLKTLNVELPNGKTTQREVIDHRQAAVIVPFIAPNKIVLVKQFRIAVGEVLYELPAGLMNDNEIPEQSAKRELQEETGYSSDDVIYCGGSYPAPGFCNEFLHFFIANNLKKQEQNLDPDEFVEPVIFTLEEIDRKISDFSLKDTKSLLGIFYLKQFLLKEGLI